MTGIKQQDNACIHKKKVIIVSLCYESSCACEKNQRMWMLYSDSVLPLP